MKRIFIVICLFILFGCYSDNFTKLGYDSTEAQILKSLSEKSQVFFSENVNDFTKALIDNKDFREENLNVYLKYKDLFSVDKIVEMVNNGTISIYNFGKVKEVIKAKEYKERNLRVYLANLNTFYFDGNVTVKACNEKITHEYKFINQLQNDSMFIIDNLDLYLKHREEKENIRDLVEFVNTKRYLTYYEDDESANIEKYGIHVLVNKYYYLDEDYEPDDLVKVEGKYGIGQLRKEAYEAYIRMQEDANKEGYNFYITSPYRSYSTQEKLYNSYLNNDIQANVDIYSARPGSSEHQLGLAADILKSGYDFGNFFTAPEAKWLADNSYKYGFILRYPESKINITGYKYEPWHFRYVGDIAEDVYKSGVTYDEYFEKYIK